MLPLVLPLVLLPSPLAVFEPLLPLVLLLPSPPPPLALLLLLLPSSLLLPPLLPAPLPPLLAPASVLFVSVLLPGAGCGCQYQGLSPALSCSHASAAHWKGEAGSPRSRARPLAEP